MIVPSEKQKQTLHYIEHDPKVTQILYGGAAFGGKTLLGCYWQIYRRLYYPGTRGLIGRAELKNLKLTTLKTFFEVWESHWTHLARGITINYNQQESVIYFSNGSEIYLKDIKHYPSDPDFHSLGSLEITDAFIDEGGESTQKAVNIIYSRIRFKLINKKPVVLIASNPANNWLKHDFVMDKNNTPVVLPDFRKYVQAKATDNPDKEKVEIYIETLNKLPLYDRLRLLDGDWSVNENDAPFFHGFNSDKHLIDSYEIDKGETVLLSFDFNINPTTAIAFQKIPGKGVFVFDCVQVKGGTEILCEELEHYIYHPSGVNVTGDFSGNSGSTTAGMLAGGVYNTDFEIIKKKLMLGSFQLINTMKVNPRHEHSRRLCNYVFEKCPIFITKNCTALITDLQIAQATDQGKLRKDRENFKMDAADAFRYGINALFQNGIQDVIKFIE
jgi:phage terminase large subunit